MIWILSEQKEGVNLDIVLFQRFHPQWAYVTMTKCVCVYELVCGSKLICRQHHITGSKLICIQHRITLVFNKCFSEWRQWQTFIDAFIFINSVRHQIPVCQREGEGNRDGERGTVWLTVLLNPDFPLVWKENFSPTFSNYHQRFLNVSNVVFFIIVFVLFIRFIPESS